jgi:iron complex transport system substrate-binding protein
MVSREGREGAKSAKGAGLTVEELATVAVDCGLMVHRDLGPGLLESVYEKVLAHRLTQCGLEVSTQVAVPIQVDGLVIDQGFRADIVVEGRLLLEIKSVERLQEVHAKQVLTYLRFMGLPLGLLMNFSGEKFSHGLKRIVNNHRDTSGSKLAMHQ